MTITIPEPMEWPLWLSIVLAILPLYLPGMLAVRYVAKATGLTRAYASHEYSDGHEVFFFGFISLFAPLVMLVVLFWLIVLRPAGWLLWKAMPD